MFLPCFPVQACLLSKCLECLVEPSVQLMRKCLPKTPLPLTSDLSAYTFPLPGRPHDMCNVATGTGFVFALCQVKATFVPPKALNVWMNQDVIRRKLCLK